MTKRGLMTNLLRISACVWLVYGVETYVLGTHGNSILDLFYFSFQQILWEVVRPIMNLAIAWVLFFKTQTVVDKLMPDSDNDNWSGPSDPQVMEVFLRIYGTYIVICGVSEFISTTVIPLVGNAKDLWRINMSYDNDLTQIAVFKFIFGAILLFFAKAITARLYGVSLRDNMDDSPTNQEQTS
jgi:hypothetical protein